MEENNQCFAKKRSCQRLYNLHNGRVCYWGCAFGELRFHSCINHYTRVDALPLAYGVFLPWYWWTSNGARWLLRVTPYVNTKAHPGASSNCISFLVLAPAVKPCSHTYTHTYTPHKVLAVGCWDEAILRHPKAVTFVKQHDATGYCFKCTQKELATAHHGLQQTYIYIAFWCFQLSCARGARAETRPTSRWAPSQLFPN